MGSRFFRLPLWIKVRRKKAEKNARKNALSGKIR